ncbi:hypothetical protein TNCV_2296221 [Trichonephila clavipes]|nr:hypothetical protein TNCV_2296221 [Trichonephila clavipes]
MGRNTHRKGHLENSNTGKTDERREKKAFEMQNSDKELPETSRNTKTYYNPVSLYEVKIKLRVHTECVLVKSVGLKVLWAESRVQGTGENFPPLQFPCLNCGGGDRWWRHLL